MKKLFLSVTFAVLLVSCKTQAPAAKTNIDRKSNMAIKGNWTIKSVTYPGSDFIKVTSFDLADAQCFVGSTWNFISNNDSGDMTLSKSGCPQITTKIKWYVNKEEQFVLKFLDESLKAKKVKEGYILKVVDQTENSFKLYDGANVGGKMVDIVYQFEKNNK